MRSDVQQLVDRAAIVEAVARYNKASLEIDLDAYGACFMPDGRYIGANNGWVAFGREQVAAAIAGTAQGGGIQHASSDFIVDFSDDNLATVRHTIIVYKRECDQGDNEVIATGYFYNSYVRTGKTWLASEVISFLDRKTDDYVVSALRALVFAREPIRDAATSLLRTDEPSLLEHVRSGRSLMTLAEGQDVSEDSLVEAVATALQDCAPDSNPLPASTARALAYVLTHDQVLGVEVEHNFRDAGWIAPRLNGSII